MRRKRDYKKGNQPEPVWQEVDTRTIILRKKPPTRTRQKTSQKTTQVKNNLRADQRDMLIQDDVEYADGATLLIAKDIHGRICERMGNYVIITETWGAQDTMEKVLILIRERKKPKE